MARTYSTKQVAEKVGIARRTLAYWLAAGKIPEPKVRVTGGGADARVWSEAEVRRVAAYKLNHYWKKKRTVLTKSPE